jgi:hypothetical protein
MMSEGHTSGLSLPFASTFPESYVQLPPQASTSAARLLDLVRLTEMSASCGFDCTLNAEDPRRPALERLFDLRS